MYLGKRFFDVSVAISLGIVCLPLIISIMLLVKLTSRGSILYWSERVGKDNIPFEMPKFRSMYESAPTVASNELTNPTDWYTPIGPFLRRSSLDELPQIWSVIKGDMSLVGPRPVLLDETELLELRVELGAHKIVPGITGLAQISGRDFVAPRQKASLDAEYLSECSLRGDLRIILLTFSKVVRQEGISH